MDLPIKFPPERDKIYQEALAFRRLSPDERFQAILDVIALGAAMMTESPHQEAMLRLQQAHEEQWTESPERVVRVPWPLNFPQHLEAGLREKDRLRLRACANGGMR